MATQAKVTLINQHGNVIPAERTLTIEAGSVAPIGRASKSLSKGLFSAADNAWFDSPVMSRDHAQIMMNAEDKTISIQDIGSMHGTYLNGIELARNVPSPLNNGDVLVFGAEVRRGPETFPACSFRVSYEFIQRKATNTYAFPESSDIEEDADGDGEDYDLSEDDNTHKQQQSSDDGVSIETTSPNVQKHSDAIDLTRDDTPEESNRIDLTGECHSDTEIIDTPGVLATTQNCTHKDSIGMVKDNIPIVVDSEGEEARFSSEDVEQSEGASGDSESSEDSSVWLDDEILHGSGESEADPEDMAGVDDAYDLDSIGGFSDIDEEDEHDDGLARFERATNNSSILLSDIRTRTQFPESVADEEDDDMDSEFGLSEAGEAGLRALMEARVCQNEEAFLDQETESESENEDEIEDKPKSVIPTIKEIVEVAAPPPPAFENIPPLKLSPSHNFTTLQAFTGDKLGISYPVMRQPSPSDAAMVKSAVPQQQDRNTVGVCEVGTFGKSSAEALGDKAGKSAFFEAREVNKARFGSGKAPKPDWNYSTGFGRSSTAVPTPSSSYPVIRRTGFGFGPSLTSKVTPSPEPTFPTREPCAFLDKPEHNPVPARTPSPQLDMTSAFSFQVSKISTNVASPTPPKSIGRGIKINDIIDTAATPQRPPLKLKRKADEISDVDDKEFRAWTKAKTSAASTVTKITLNRSDKKAPTVADIKVTDLSPPPAPSVPTAPVTSETRPAKRMKKLLENVGYAALGGVAVGAGLFTVLVATAPDFL